jgi:hypothetical protein
MDFLHLHTDAFPVQRGTLSCLRDEPSDYRWCLEIHSGPSTQQDDPNRSDDTEEVEMAWLAGAEPYLYAQLLPLRVDSPDDLIGRRYTFPQSPEDDPPDWEEAEQWPFFCLYTSEHDYVHPVSLTFTARREGQYRVEIEGRLPIDDTCYDLRVRAWLDWEG